MLHFTRWFLNNPFTLGTMCMTLVFVSVLGMWGQHKYGWEHWFLLGTMSHRMDQIKPPHYVTREECQEMIDDAIRKHNRNAGIISMCVGWVVLALFVEGSLRLIGVIDPYCRG